MGATDAGLGDPDHSPRNHRSEPGERLAVDVEGLEVSGVHAEQVRTGAERADDLLLGVHLDQWRQADRTGPVDECRERVVVQRGDDQQCEVGARRARLPQLVRGHDEVLA